jgi:type IV secretory pathway TraG/TraD family ATPase VirD4
MPDRLASAQWESPQDVSRQYPFAEGKFWLGRNEEESPLGYCDDRHICLVSGTRGGKGTSLIVNNLCFWPGSAVVVDPKGENATVTAARRGRGNKYCTGLGQSVHVLDPFMAADVDESYRSSFNPFDALDPNSDETIDEASRLADAIVVVKDGSHDPFWDESARKMLRGLILHVLTAEQFMPDERNLITLRNLVLRGAWEIAECIREQGHDEEKIEAPHLLLWRSMEANPAFGGLVAATGLRFRTMMKSSDKTFDGVLQSVDLHTEFLDSPAMQRCLAKSDFKLSELKTRPEGMTLYLSLPQRFMNTHHRWLRMMVVLTTTQMEITRGNPATGHPVLMILDEFAGLKRMEAIEKGVAQLAGFGVKLFFVLQSLEQLKGTYPGHWETFLANAGLKVFFSIEDHFTREYVSKLAGETEIIRELRSANESQAQNESRSDGRSQTETLSKSKTDGTSSSQTKGTSRSTNTSRTTGFSESHSFNATVGENESSGSSFSSSGYSSNRSSGSSHSTSYGHTTGFSSSTSHGVTDGTSRSDTGGKSFSKTLGVSEAAGTSQTTTQGTSRTAGTGRNETVHRRPLIQPDEVGRFFARRDDKNDPFYPGLALVIATGANPLMVRRTHYFEDLQFIDCFSPHPDHKFLAPASYMAGGIRPLIEQLEAAGGKRLTIAKWLIKVGEAGQPNQVAAIIKHVPPDNLTVSIYIPCSGKVTQTAAVPENLLQGGDYAIPEWPLFTIKNYPDSVRQGSGDDPFSELHLALELCAAYREREKRAASQEKHAASQTAEPLCEKAEARRSKHAALLADLLADLRVFSPLFKPRIKSFIIGLAITVPMIELEGFEASGHLINPLEKFGTLLIGLLACTVGGNLFRAWLIISPPGTKKRRFISDAIARVFKNADPSILGIGTNRLVFSLIVIMLLGAFAGLAWHLVEDTIRLFS